MDLSLSFYVVTALAVFITGLSKSGFGGGLGVMSVPMMSLFVEPRFAAAVLMPVLLAMDVLIVLRFWNKWSFAVLRPLLTGAALGLVIGTATFQWMDANAIRFTVGVMAVFFVGQFLFKQGRLATSSGDRFWAGSFLGSISGFSSFIAHAGGPPVKGYLLAQDLEKTSFVATNTLFFFILNATKFGIYGALGTLNTDSVSVSLVVAPALFLGIALGAKLHQHMDQRFFVKIVYGFLAITAFKLLHDSIPALFS
ncbi:hypothetical protein DL239_08420 [Sedimentitalea sp. CY04]|uniref:Probable membrane transporter protein n=1 Tax=Parasedimentitalea denitrificans TaxID=2211118 RepID=A0ABX0W5S9_9RHOB|nr:sulfite exporter TauE/SafE family protein [Sedimentitalea sp. CY04]NIZ60998.1 hypothetical protein [Sedimentitalea sp. CY04]